MESLPQEGSELLHPRWLLGETASEGSFQRVPLRYFEASFKGSIRAPLRDLQGFFSGFFNGSCQGSSGFDRSFIRVQDAESSGLVIRVEVQG